MQALLKLLERQNRQIQVLVKKVDDVQEHIQTLRPQAYPHPILKPRQGKEFSRSTSVAGCLFEEIEALNAEIREGEQNYLQFPNDVDFRRLKSDCIRELEGLLSHHIPEMCEKFTWEEACCQRPKDCEQVIREAKVLPELAVFVQAAGQWALRMLCANKTRTMIATNTTKMLWKRKNRNPKSVNRHATMEVDNAHDAIGEIQALLEARGEHSCEHEIKEDGSERSPREPYQKDQAADVTEDYEEQTRFNYHAENTNRQETLE